MPESRSHDKPYYEPERHDGLSDGVPAEQAQAREERTADGRLAPGASKIPRAGGKALKGRTRTSHEITVPQVSEKLRKRAAYFRRAQCAELARTVGGGVCGITESLLVKLASEDMALREAALEAGQHEQARKFGESARMHLLYARELAAKNAKARASAAPEAPWLVQGGGS